MWVQLPSMFVFWDSPLYKTNYRVIFCEFCNEDAVFSLKGINFYLNKKNGIGFIYLNLGITNILLSSVPNFKDTDQSGRQLKLFCCAKSYVFPPLRSGGHMLAGCVKMIANINLAGISTKHYHMPDTIPYLRSSQPDQRWDIFIYNFTAWYKSDGSIYEL